MRSALFASQSHHIHHFFVDADLSVRVPVETMRSPSSVVVPMLVLTLAAPLIGPVLARAKQLQWANRLGSCEPPAVFYSAKHRAGSIPCCPTVENICAGGTACPVSGVCGDGKACKPSPIANRPNVVLYISDDQGYCDYGTAGECRSVETGTPIPPPSTPNLDLLAGYGTVFPIAHNTASWCFPSLATIVTGRYQRSMAGKVKIGDEFTTISKAMRSLGDDGAAPAAHCVRPSLRPRASPSNPGSPVEPVNFPPRNVQ